MAVGARLGRGKQIAISMLCIATPYSHYPDHCLQWPPRKTLNSMNLSSRGIVIRTVFLTCVIPLLIVLGNQCLSGLAGAPDPQTEECPVSECLLCTLAINPMVETLIFQCLFGQVLIALCRSPTIAIIGASIIFGGAHYWVSPHLSSVLSATIAGILFSQIYTSRATAGLHWLGIIEAYIAHASTNTLVWLMLPSTCQYRLY